MIHHLHVSNEFHHKMVLKYGMQSWLPENWIYKKSRMKTKLIYGVGINDVEFSVQPNIEGKQLKHTAYIVWTSMLRRAYSDKYKITGPTYTGVEVCDEWLLFTNFAKWFKDNYIEGWQLDKDLLVKDNRIYGPNTCIFLPQSINLFLTLHDAKRGVLPIGVTLHQGKFQSQMVGSKHKKHLGYFTDKEEAHRAWQKAKLERAIAFNFPPLQRVIDQLTYDIENNLETKIL